MYIRGSVLHSIHRSFQMPARQPAFILKNLGLFRKDRWILKALSWSVSSGSCSAILGPNGSGKSPLARILSAHLYPTTGEVTVLGHKFGETNLPDLRRHIRLVQPA